MAKKLPTKKVILIKLISILILGIVLGISLLFSEKIESLLGIGAKDSGFVSKETVFDDGLTIHYLDVGQGDSTLICLPDDTVMLIDAGTSKSAKHIITYLESLNIKTIDYFILTHSDADHSGGAKRVFEAFEIKTIYRPFQISVVDDSAKPLVATPYEDLADYLDIYPGSLNVIETATYRDFITAAYTEFYTEGGVKLDSEVVVHYDGLKIEPKGNDQDLFTFEFFAPLKRSEHAINTGNTTGYPTKDYGNKSAESKNAASPVMLLEYKENSFVFTGDATDKVEEDFLASLSLDERERFSKVDVFQAGHHGSTSSNCEKLLDLLRPDFTVASAGKGNSYKHPTEEFQNRLKTRHGDHEDYLLITYEIGDITFGYVHGELVYAANQAGTGVVIYWWYIAVGIFVVGTIVIISLKITSNKKATAKRAVSQTKKVVKKMNTK